MLTIRFPAFNRVMRLAFFLPIAWAVCRAAEPALAPVVVPIRELNLFRDFGSLPEQNVGCVAVGSDERRHYVGVCSSRRSDLRNLAVLTLNADGAVVGESRRYEVGDEPLAPGFDASFAAHACRSTTR